MPLPPEARARDLERRRRIGESLGCTVRESDWVPFPKQGRFLACSAFEAMFGGAAGPGKSEVLVIGALRYIDHPAYSALLLRRKAADLDPLIQRAAKYYCRIPGVRMRRGGKLWLFPSGARIMLGGAEHENDIEKYSSLEVQYVGFDETSHFTERQWTFMISRLRGPSEIPLMLRGATNPGNVGHEWIVKRFAPWLYPPDSTEYRGPRAGDGETLYFDTIEGTEEERIVPVGTPGARARAFFHASIADNPIYAGSDYERNLRALPLLDRMRLLHGDWMARPAAGLFFKRIWFVDPTRNRVLLEHAPGRILRRIRYWDLAGTEKERAAKGGAWTAGLRYVKTDDGAIPYAIEDVARGQWSPGEVESQIVSLAHTDPDGTEVVIELDPGQAGKFQANYFLRHPQLQGIPVRMARPSGDKLTRARTPSAAAEQGLIGLVRGDWNDPFLREGEAFPESTKDQIDALSGAHRQLALLSSGKGTGKRPSGGSARAQQPGRARGGF